MIFINFKTYEKGTGEGAVDLVKTLEKASLESGIKIIPVVQAGDVKEIVGMTKLEVWTQHIDPVEYGAHTGFILPEEVKEDGAVGTFLNHSEHKFSDIENLKKAVERAKSVGLKTLIFADNFEELKKVSELKPDFLSYEPSELVGSATISVSTAHPDIVAKAVEFCKSIGIPLIVGAGVHSREDVQVGLKLGALGFAVASDIMKAEDPKKEIGNLLEGYK